MTGVPADSGAAAYSQEPCPSKASISRCTDPEFEGNGTSTTGKRGLSIAHFLPYPILASQARTIGRKVLFA